MKEYFCDNCGRQIPSEELSLGKAHAKKGRMFCPVCWRERRSLVRHRQGIAIAVGVTALNLLLLAILIGRGEMEEEPEETGAVKEISFLKMELRETGTRIGNLETELARLSSRVETLIEIVPGSRLPKEVPAEPEEPAGGEPAPSPSPGPEAGESDPEAENGEEPAQPAPPAPTDPRLPVYRERLKSADSRTRYQAVKDVRLEGLEGLTTEVIPLLKDEYSFVRREAAETLGAMEVKSAVPELVDLLKTETDLLVRTNALKALERITGIPSPKPGSEIPRQTVLKWNAWYASNGE